MPRKTFTRRRRNSRFNVDVAHRIPGGASTGGSARSSRASGATPAQIVVERAMYWDAVGQRWAAGTNALATRIQ